MDTHQHFNDIANEYDKWKEKNSYYYDAIKTLLRSKIPSQARVLEVGCGTGDLLAVLSPSVGLGIDISEVMVTLAQKKYADRSELSFRALDITTLTKPLPYDYIFLVDVLEHIENLPKFLEGLKQVVLPNAKIIITLANPLWETVLMLAEKLGMKMPEGPHWRLSIKENERLFKQQGGEIAERGYRLLVPKKIPGADFLNEKFHKSKLLAPLGFIVYWELIKA